MNLRPRNKPVGPSLVPGGEGLPDCGDGLSSKEWTVMRVEIEEMRGLRDEQGEGRFGGFPGPRR